jgi:hypothetical protein
MYSHLQSVDLRCSRNNYILDKLQSWIGGHVDRPRRDNLVMLDSMFMERPGQTSLAVFTLRI